MPNKAPGAFSPRLPGPNNSLRSKVSSKLDGRSREGGDEGDEELIRNVRPVQLRSYEGGVVSPHRPLNVQYMYDRTTVQL